MTTAPQAVINAPQEPSSIQPIEWTAANNSVNLINAGNFQNIYLDRLEFDIDSAPAGVQVLWLQTLNADKTTWTNRAAISLNANSQSRSRDFGGLVVANPFGTYEPNVGIVRLVATTGYSVTIHGSLTYTISGVNQLS